VTRSRFLAGLVSAMIVLPSVVLAVLGYRSLDAELRAQAEERRSRVRQGFARAWSAVERTLSEIHSAESARPFWDYRSVVIGRDAVTGEPISRHGPLRSGPDVPWIRGYWQVDVERRELTTPGPRPESLLRSVSEHVRRTPPSTEPDLRPEPRGHPRRLVAANLPPVVETRRLDVGTDDVTTVLYGPLRYHVDPSGDTVFVRRTVRWEEGGRTLRQGFVVDVRAFLRETAASLDGIAGDPEVLLRVVPTPPRSYAYPPNRPLSPLFPHLSLLAEEADGSRDAFDSIAGARERFVLLVGALFAVIAAGLFLVRRTVRAEIELARRRADFVAAVSHELRTPLTGIRMYADMLREGWVDDEATVREYHEALARESERLSRLVQNVLDFSALEKGRKDFRMEEGDLAGPVRDAIDLLGPYLAEKGFEVATDLPEDLPPVLRDADAVQQCVVNLLDNAVKYARDREPRRIEVALTRRDGAIDLTVRDHGPGLGPEDRARVFDPFFRGSSPSTREVGGAGLGLSLVRRFARAHGGTAGAEAAPDGGSLFRVTFPVA
jgi:signal transduction histidine kinase